MSNSLDSDPTTTTNFQYNDIAIEVVIIDNGDDDRDGYVEVACAAELLTPIVTIRNFNKAVLWANVPASQKLIRNNKNYVHVFALCRYLSTYNLSQKSHPSAYFIVKQLICDLLVGAQSQIIDPINDIKTQICSLQDCLTSSNTFVGGGGGGDNINYAIDYHSLCDAVRECLRAENNTLYANLTASLDNVKSMQLDLTNKLAFSNDTMLDNFKSIKDMMVRKI